MAAYRRRVGGAELSHSHHSHHLQADCQEPGSASEPYARQSSMDYLYLLATSNSLFRFSSVPPLVPDENLSDFTDCMPFLAPKTNPKHYTTAKSSLKLFLFFIVKYLFILLRTR